MGIFTLASGHKMEIFVQDQTVAPEAKSRPAILRHLVEANGGLCVEKGKRAMVYVIVDCGSQMAESLVGKNSVEDPNNGCAVGVVRDAWVEDCIRKQVLLDDDTIWGGHYIPRTYFFPKQLAGQAPQQGVNDPANRSQLAAGLDSQPAVQSGPQKTTTMQWKRGRPPKQQRRPEELSSGVSLIPRSSNAMKRAATEEDRTNGPKKHARFEIPVDVSQLSFGELRGGEGIEHRQRGRFTFSEQAALVTFMKANPPTFEHPGPSEATWKAFAREIRSERPFKSWKTFFDDNNMNLNAQAASTNSVNANERRRERMSDGEDPGDEEIDQLLQSPSPEIRSY